MDLQGFERLRLVGDEDCGVGLQCSDCWDGGRPLVQYESDLGAVYPDPKVPVVHTLTDLMAAARAHLDEQHRP